MYIAKHKRVVKLPHREIDLGDWYLTDFIQPNSYGAESVTWEAWKRLINLYNNDIQQFIKLANIIGLYNMYIKELWNVVNVKIKYRYDDPIFQTSDFWLLPNETWYQKHGDCEDTTFLLLSAIYKVKEGWKDDIIAKEAIEYGCIGYYIDYKGTPYGHAFIIRRTDRIANGKWLWIETTLENEVPQYIWYLADFNKLIPVYFFTDVQSYRIDKDYSKLGLTKVYVERYKELIDMMIEYVESGKQLRIKWMHKGKRTPLISRNLYIHCLEVI